MGAWLYAKHNDAPSESWWRGTPEEAVWARYKAVYPASYDGKTCQRVPNGTLGTWCWTYPDNRTQSSLTATVETGTVRVYEDRYDASGVQYQSTAFNVQYYGTTTLTTAGSQYLDNCNVTDPPPAPPPPVCEAGNSYPIQAVGPSEAGIISAFNNTCHNGCKVTASSLNDFFLPSGESPGDVWGLIKITETGEECGGSDPALPPTEEPPPEDPVPEEDLDGEQCITSANGVEYCDAGPYGENCGYVNGDYVCLGKTDSDECWVNSDGSRLCGESAPMPPVPDSGTPGQKATPDDTVQHTGPGGTSNTYNYYNSGTVAGSSNPPGDSGANPNRPDSYNPSTEPTPVIGVGGEGEGGEQGGEAYDPTTPELSELETFGELTQAFWDGVQAAPIVSAWTNIGASVPAGSCPSYSLSVFGQTYSFTEFMCELWGEQVAPVLSLVFLFVWPFIGLRIVMSA